MAEQAPRFRYDVATRRYRAADGRFVPAARVASAVDAVAVGARAEAERLAERLLAGQSSLAEFQSSLAALVKAGHVAAGAVGRGGTAQMSPADAGFVGSRIKREYGYLRDFAAQIADGRQPLDGMLRVRAGLYGDALATTHREMERRIAALSGVQIARRVLAAADHCATCLSEAARGWQPITLLRAIGDTICRSRDKCRFEYRRPGEAAA